MREPPDRRAIRAAYDRVASRYDQLHGNARARKRFDVIDAPQLAIARDGRVLELGCGTGRLLAQVASPKRLGIDLSVPMLRRARERGLTAICADAVTLPFAAASFDAIIAGKGTFRYLHYERAFAECVRVLAPGGRLAVHQYAASTWTLGSPLRLLRRPGLPRTTGSRNQVDARQRETQANNGPDHWAGQGRDSLHVGRLHELYVPARLHGLIVERTHLWRSVRVWPYVVAIPPWMPGTLWSHCVVIFRKPPQTATNQ